MATIFTKIILGEISSYKIAEDENFFAFLDIRPNTKGHTLVVPKKEVDKLFDLDESTYIELFKFSKKVAAAIEKTIPCDRVGLSVIGLEVPHAHVHLIPIQTESDMFFQKKVSLSDSEFSELAKSIAKNF